MKAINELYHINSKIQRRVINNWNFTYGGVIPFLDGYLKDKKQIIDIGSGVGTLDFYISAPGVKILGVEDSERAVKIAKTNSRYLGLTNINFKRADIEKLRLRQRFDAALLIEVIEHVDRDWVLLHKIYDLLTHGGIFLLSTPLKDSPLSRLGLSRYHDRRVGHVRRYSKNGLLRKIRASGFKILRCDRKTGVLRELLFLFPAIGNPIVRVANKFHFFSILLTLVDNLSLIIFGPSQLIVVSEKI